MEAKTKKVLFYVAVGLLVAAAVVFGIVEVAGGVEPDVVPVDSVAQAVDTLVQAVDTLVVDSAVVDTVAAL